MKNGTMRKLAGVFFACALACALAGCATGGAASTAKTAEQENRAYMSQVNESMSKLRESFEPFVDAVSRGDVVGVRTQADNAYKVLDELETIEAPNDMTDIRAQYLEGADKMREALDAYIELYTEAVAEGDDYDWSAQGKRIESIQKLYDEGKGALEAADEAVAIAAAGDAAGSSSSSSASA